MSIQYIYIVISRTQTRFARCIRLFGGIKYNHTAISLDQELQEMYAFARPQHNAIFLGRLVRETLDRYTLRKNNSVPAVVFRLPVSLEEYENVRNLIEQISGDSEYMYNLFSVLTYPVFRGFSTYKAFNCTEFAAYVLKQLNYPLELPAYRYKPDDLLEIFQEQIVYEGDLRTYMADHEKDDGYFAPFTWKLVYQNLCAMVKIAARTCRRNL